MHISQAIGRKMKELRLENRYSQDAIAAVIERDQNIISRMERGLIEPKPSTLYKLSIFFNIPISDFFEHINN